MKENVVGAPADDSVLLRGLTALISIVLIRTRIFSSAEQLKLQPR